MLDDVTMVARTGFGHMHNITASMETEESVSELMLRGIVDWDAILRMGNTSVDEIVRASQLPTRAERKAAAVRLEAGGRPGRCIPVEWTLAGQFWTGRALAFTNRLGDIFLKLFLSPLLAAFDSDDRKEMQSELTGLAFALAEFRADSGAYPEKLSELVPDYIAEIPQDLFTATDLRYERHDDGYLLYSLGPDGKDDGGKSHFRDEDYTETWDVSVRIPSLNTRPTPEPTQP